MSFNIEKDSLEFISQSFIVPSCDALAKLWLSNVTIDQTTLV